jgi:uncharacterized protein YqeY
MLRQRLTDALKVAMKRRAVVEVATLRLILAALKDRDIAARTKGDANPIDDDGLLRLLQTMVKQRNEAIALYEQGGRLELAERERDEIAVIETYLPRQLDEAEIEAAVRQVIEDTGASGLKNMGATMAELRRRHAGSMNFAKASDMVKRELG